MALIILGGVAAAWVAFAVGVGVGAWQVGKACEAERQEWITSGTEIEAKAIMAQREAEELRADNIRLLDEKLSAS
jgi:hypothetical protein